MRLFARKAQQLAEKVWCLECAETNNLKYNETSVRKTPKKLKHFALEQQNTHTSTVMDCSIPFHTVFEVVDAHDITNEKFKLLVYHWKLIK